MGVCTLIQHRINGDDDVTTDYSFRVEAALQHWYVTGLQQGGAVPSLIASVGDSSSSLLRVVFELNPEESAADQLLRVYSQPVEVIYDAVIHLFSLLSVLLRTNIIDCLYEVTMNWTCRLVKLSFLSCS